MSPTKFILLVLCAVNGLIGLSGCDQLPGKPKLSDRWQPPEAEKNFKVLFSGNCQGCHAGEANIGAAISMRDPLYLAVVPRDVLRKVIVEGIPGPTIPGFLKPNGAHLTHQQLAITAPQILTSGKPPQIPN